MNKPTFLLAFLFLAFIRNLAAAQTHDIAYYTKNAPFKMPDVPGPVIPNQTFSITAYGAVSDGKTLNTQAIAKAIDACSKAGGGHVIIPAGNWQTGPIEMKSNLDLHVEKGANVIFTTDHTQYPMMAESKNSYTVTPPIWGNKLENVSITGEGSFDGNGQTWRPLKKGKVSAAEWQSVVASGGVLSADGKIWWPSRDALNGEAYLKQLKNKQNVTAEDYLPARDYLRPKMVVINNTKNLMIDGPTFKNSPMFVINPKGITNLIIRNTKVHNDYSAQNGDGIDISASKNVVIYRTTVSVGDDGICMKSSGNGDENNAALENVLIAECTVLQGHGGFVIGSNTDGGMKNIYVTNCNFFGTDIGIRVKSNAGRGGPVHAVFIDQISMSKIINEAVLFDTYYEDVPAGKEKGAERTVNDKVPDFHDFHISNIICKGARTAMFFRGLPAMPVHDIYFENVNIEAEEGVVAKSIKDITFKNVKLVTAKKPAIAAADLKFIKVTD
ncbi:glycoside hydrolase family 28 protein [Mucilaginibacter arboris]|uniref:Glycoside hydrolase family 28 protein n=1 Tax=Mucilaginibacter arboris TaxID=2682090 RepID=A0A7K1SS95_9SPHI|nr:glycoside hydrolase family 28 protein [Mucilaginibacter arboris]MVN20175.1 glycoside hydrolase family 28 protein [Mucilaginibacter arboris]